MSREFHDRRPKLLAVSSGGGHWVQLLRIAPAFENCDVTFVTVHEFISGTGSQSQILCGE